jgi:hypothetical protein
LGPSIVATSAKSVAGRTSIVILVTLAPAPGHRQQAVHRRVAGGLSRGAL